MPHLAFDIGFCAQLGKLQGTVKQGVFDAWDKFERLTLEQLFKDQGLKLEALKQAKDPQIRTIRIAQGTRGVVLAPDRGDTFVLLRVMPHDKAIAWAIKQKASINAVTRAVEIRDIAMLDELTPAYERIAAAPDQRLFSKVADGDLTALGIDETTLRQARALTSKEQLKVFAPYFPQDQREVLEYLAEGFSVEDVWRDLVSVSLPTASADPVDTSDYETAIGHTRTRIALITVSDELRDILDKPFTAWRIFLHPSQHRVAYRASYSGPAQVTGGPGTGKTVVALHRVRHLLTFLRDGERILLTPYTNALVAALRSGLAALVEDEGLRERVDITTVDALASRVVSTSRRRCGAARRRPAGSRPRTPPASPAPPSSSPRSTSTSSSPRTCGVRRSTRPPTGGGGAVGFRPPIVRWCGVRSRSSPTGSPPTACARTWERAQRLLTCSRRRGRCTGTSSSTRPRTCTPPSGGSCAPLSPRAPTTCSSPAIPTSGSTTRRCR